MTSIAITGCKPYDGHYELDFNQELTTREWGWIKRHAGYLPLAATLTSERIFEAFLGPADAGMQLLGMAGWWLNAVRTTPWLLHLLRGRSERYEAPPTTPIPFRSVAGGRAPHGLDRQRVTRVRAPAEAALATAEVGVSAGES